MLIINKENATFKLFAIGINAENISVNISITISIHINSY